MIKEVLGRFFQDCIRVAQRAEKGPDYDLGHSDFMTDEELSHCLHGRGHLVDWAEVKRREAAGEVKTTWPVGPAAGGVR